MQKKNHGKECQGKQNGMTHSEHRKSEFRQEAVTGSTVGQKIKNKG